MKCSILLCDREYVHVLYYKSYNKSKKSVGMCESCYRAYRMGRQHQINKTPVENNKKLRFE